MASSKRKGRFLQREGFFKNAKLFSIGDDEETCPSSCNLEEGDSCLWTNDVDNDMDWTIGQTDIPPYDHTKGDYTGHFLHLKGNKSGSFECCFIINLENVPNTLLKCKPFSKARQERLIKKLFWINHEDMGISFLCKSRDAD